MEKELKAELLETLELRFNKNPQRHSGLDWKLVLEKLEAKPSLLDSLFLMEETGGEPDVVIFNSSTEEFSFVDCSKESPIGRRSFCYDQEALEARKKFKPANSAMALAQEMGVELLNEVQYKELQELGEFDLKTSSWIITPPAIRNLGGALFCDRRYDHVFTYHNGADSYYAARGFRAILSL
ncbi:DUF4256 domain-containing protein [Algoriphagus zhangzhouensis]|nr:DUF4256 domain-containing protein [Algoriphagus zhangzhouensis]